MSDKLSNWAFVCSPSIYWHLTYVLLVLFSLVAYCYYYLSLSSHTGVSLFPHSCVLPCCAVFCALSPSWLQRNSSFSSFAGATHIPTTSQTPPKRTNLRTNSHKRSRVFIQHTAGIEPPRQTEYPVSLLRVVRAAESITKFTQCERCLAPPSYHIRCFVCVVVCLYIVSA